MTLDPLCCKVAYAFPTGNRWSVAQFFFFSSVGLLVPLQLEAFGIKSSRLHLS